MSKRVRSLIIGAVVMLVLVAVLVILLFINKDKQEKLKAESDKIYSDIANSYIDLINESIYDFEKVSIKNQQDEFNIVLAGENAYTVDGFKDFAQSKDMLNSVVNSVCKVISSGIVKEDVTDLESFGLKNPLATFQTKVKGKDSTSISVGNLSSDGSIQYVCKTGENTVYQVPANSFSYIFDSKFSFIDKTFTQTPSKTSDDANQNAVINKMTISRADLESPIVLEEYDKGSFDNPYSVLPAPIKMVSPVNANISENDVKDYIYNNFSIMADDVVAVNPTEQQIAEYGLDSPSAQLDLKYDGTGNLSIKLGKKTTVKNTDTPAYYAISNDKKIVYVVDESKLPFLKVTPKDIISSIAVLVHIENIDNVLITAEGAEYNLDFTHTKKDDKTTTQATFNGEEAVISNAKTFLQILMGTSITDICYDKPTGNPVISIKYNYIDGSSFDKVDFYVNATDRSCIVVLNDETAFKSRTGLTDKLLKELKNISQGNNVNPVW
ncbi:MAG: DUF4340 domain-containing protein [Oscillospiraceae bacterium]